LETWALPLPHVESIPFPRFPSFLLFGLPWGPPSLLGKSPQFYFLPLFFQPFLFPLFWQTSFLGSGIFFYEKVILFPSFCPSPTRLDSFFSFRRPFPGATKPPFLPDPPLFCLPLILRLRIFGFPWQEQSRPVPLAFSRYGIAPFPPRFCRDGFSFPPPTTPSFFRSGLFVVIFFFSLNRIQLPPPQHFSSPPQFLFFFFFPKPPNVQLSSSEAG